MNSFKIPFLAVVTGAMAQLQNVLESKSRLEHLLLQLGWRANLQTGQLQIVQSMFGLDAKLSTIKTLIEDMIYNRGVTASNADTLMDSIEDLYKLIAEFSNMAPVSSIAPFNNNNFWNTLSQDLIPYLLVEELKESSPVVYGILFFAGVVQQTVESPTGSERVTYRRISLNWGNLRNLLNDPGAVVSQRYGWGQVLQHRQLLTDVAALATLFPLMPRISGVPASISDVYYDDNEIIDRKIASLILPLIAGKKPDGSGAVELGLSLTPIPDVALNGQVPTGFLLAPYLHGGYFGAIPLSADLSLEFIGAFASDNAFGVEIRPNGVKLESNISGTAIGAEIRLTGNPQRPLRLFGSDTTSRVELSGYMVGIGVRGTVAQPELLLRVGTGLPNASGGRLTMLLETGDGDSFLSKAFGPDPIKLEVAGFITWSSKTGLGIDGDVGLHIRRATNNKVGPLTFHDYSLDIAADTNHPLSTEISLGASLKIGPVTATVEQIGVEFQLTNNASGQKGLLDNIGVSWGFKGPKGIGIEVDSDTLSGGGYLFLDPANHQYAGVANLKLKTTGQEINLNALGLLQTELPGNPDAYSLLLLIAATFNPMQLGLGFTLNGIGGLLGVNRATDTDYLRGLVRSGHLDQLLFPANVLDSPAAALALVDAAFPATEGRYVIGLLARLGWGTPTSLITLDVALLIELPSPVRLAILGVLEATLPSKDKDLLKLRADFLGTVDFGSKRAAFDATLSDSHLLAFALTGDLAFRFYQGNNPLFVITAGGFHPAFQPPAGAGLTGLRRLTLALARGNDLRVTLTSYLAVTSNTVQFGSRLELYYRIARGLHVQGYFGFDVLFQFNPFHVQAHIEAGVAIKYGRRELLSLHLSLDVTGPGPWHIWGSASFKVWFVRIHVNVDATIGSGRTEPALPATDVKTLLVSALNAATSWEVEPPQTALPGGVVLRPVGSTSADFFLDPRGALLLRQRVVPLGVPLGKYGRGPIAPTTGRRFDLTELVVAGVHHPVATDRAVETVRDFFAPDQFQQLTDAQKLSLPSFQRLPCGLRLASLAGLVADATATLRVVEYEHKRLDGTSGGATTSRPPRMSAKGYQQLVRGGALGQEIEAVRPSARVPQPINWAEDAYVVVHAATLEVYDPVSHTRFATQVEAEQYRQELVAATPALAGEVLVVPEYQLELA